jgi:hypothetical protein
MKKCSKCGSSYKNNHSCGIKGDWSFLKEPMTNKKREEKTKRYKYIEICEQCSAGAEEHDLSHKVKIIILTPHKGKL